MWWWREDLPSSAAAAVSVGFTDAEGGVSTGPVGALNLGGAVGDDPAHVARNRAMVADAVQVPADRLVFMHQTHSTRVVTLREGDLAGPQQPLLDGDAVVTDVPDLALAVLVADCTPVLLVDAAHGVIGAVHAGRPGMLGRIVSAALDAMAELGGTSPTAVVGPSVCGRCYEVPAAMRDAAAQVAAASRTVSWTGTPAATSIAGVVAQLAERDVPVTWVPGCTRENERLYSYRRDHATGRFAGVIVRRSSPAVATA